MQELLKWPEFPGHEVPPTSKPITGFDQNSKFRNDELLSSTVSQEEKTQFRCNPTVINPTNELILHKQTAPMSEYLHLPQNQITKDKTVRNVRKQKKTVSSRPPWVFDKLIHDPSESTNDDKKASESESRMNVPLSEINHKLQATSNSKRKPNPAMQLISERLHKGMKAKVDDVMRRLKKAEGLRVNVSPVICPEIFSKVQDLYSRSSHGLLQESDYSNLPDAKVRDC
jgi:hypothetical protein